VLATDIETRWLDLLDRDEIEVARHDIAREPLKAASFDLIHARGVLCHISQWPDAVAHMIEALRPGGWICLEEPDWLTSGLSHPPTPALERFWNAVGQLMTSTGGDPSVGRKLAAALAEAHLHDIGGEAWVLSRRDGLETQLDLLGEVLSTAGLMTADEIAAARGEAAAPGLTYSPMFVATWGKRPVR